MKRVDVAIERVGSLNENASRLIVEACEEIATADRRFAQLHPPMDMVHDGGLVAHTPVICVIARSAARSLAVAQHNVSALIDLERIFVLEAREEREPIGLLVASIEESPVTLQREGVIQLAFVKREFRRLGICRDMIVHAVGEFRRGGCVVAWLETMHRNTVATTTWEKLGFEAVYTTMRAVLAEPVCRPTGSSAGRSTPS